MTDSLENGIEFQEKGGDLRIYNIPKEDWEFFQELMRVYGRKGNVAFRAMIDAYNVSRVIGELYTKIDLIEQKIKSMESPVEIIKKVPLTFGMKGREKNEQIE